MPTNSPPPEPGAVEQVNEGNPYVFCDYVRTAPGAAMGCARGAGHSGPHLLLENGPIPLSPVRWSVQPSGAQEPAILRELVEKWNGSPWPIQAVLRKLAEAVNHLLSAHDCDHRGWEGVTYAKNRAIAMADELDAAALRGQTPEA